MILYTAKWLVDGTGRQAVRDPYVIVNEGRIVEVGAGRPPEGVSPDAQVVDYGDATLLPGLVDGHLHLALALPRDDWPEIKDDPARLAMAAAHGARETLRAGVTTVADCGGRHGVTIALRDAIAEGGLVGSRVWACGTWLTITNGHGYFWTEWGLDSAEALRRGVRRMVWEGADFIKIMASGGTTHGQKTNRRRAQYSVEELRVAVEDAHRLNKRVTCHVNATEAMRVCIEAGVDVVEHCNWLGDKVGTVEYIDWIARLGAEKGISAGINAPFARLADLDGRAEDWGDTLRWELMRRMQAAGMRVFVNTDAIGRDWAALRRVMVRMVDEGLADAAEAIELVTSAPASALGLEDEIGSLAPGRLADLLVVPGNLLRDFSALERPLAVIKEGRVVVRDGQIVC